MKIQTSLASLFAACLTAVAEPGSTNSTLILSWDWVATNGVVNQGPLTYPQFLTNVYFQLYQSVVVGTNATPFAPYFVLAPAGVTISPTTNNVPIIAYTVDGTLTNFSVTIPATNSLSFVAITTVTAGGESSFSNVLTLVPAQPGGQFNAPAKGKP